MINFLKVLPFLKTSSRIQLRFSESVQHHSSVWTKGLGSDIFNTPRPKQCWVSHFLLHTGRKNHTGKIMGSLNKPPKEVISTF